jgi:hypothetical protein
MQRVRPAAAMTRFSLNVLVGLGSSADLGPLIRPGQIAGLLRGAGVLVKPRHRWLRRARNRCCGRLHVRPQAFVEMLPRGKNAAACKSIDRRGASRGSSVAQANRQPEGAE